MAEVFFEPVHILGYIDHRIVVGNDLVGRIFAPSRGQRYFTVELIHGAPFAPASRRSSRRGLWTEPLGNAKP